MSKYHWHFNDGLGWRGGAAYDSATKNVEDVISEAKEHWLRWPNDHLRVILQTGPHDFKDVWWQDGAEAEPRGPFTVELS